MQGPITVFEGGTYAGDARILDLQPNEERLLSYAIDLGTEVNPVPVHRQRHASLTRQGGQGRRLHTTTKVREIKTYTDQEPQRRRSALVLVEHPVNNAFKLVEREAGARRPATSTASRSRCPPARRKTQVVTEERDVGQHVSASATSDDEQIRFFISQPVASDEGQGGPAAGDGPALGAGQDAARDRASCSGS